MPLLSFLHSHSTVLKAVGYGYMLTLAAIFGACLAIHNGFREDLVMRFLAGFVALCFLLLAVEEHRREEMTWRDWQMRARRRDSG